MVKYPHGISFAYSNSYLFSYWNFPLYHAIKNVMGKDSTTNPNSTLDPQDELSLYAHLTYQEHAQLQVWLNERYEATCEIGSDDDDWLAYQNNPRKSLSIRGLGKDPLYIPNFQALIKIKKHPKKHTKNLTLNPNSAMLSLELERYENKNNHWSPLCPPTKRQHPL